jgi:hypothetical protein
MRRVDVHGVGESVRLFPAETLPTRSRNTLFGIWIRISVQPAAVFIVLSLAFGGLVISGTPPLRGPDEISHFLRIYSYARGEILPHRGGLGCLNSFSASISGASAAVRLPSGVAAG